jgi:hypothetical protein
LKLTKNRAILGNYSFSLKFKVSNFILTFFSNSSYLISHVIVKIQNISFLKPKESNMLSKDTTRLLPQSSNTREFGKIVLSVALSCFSNYLDSTS